MDLDPARCYRAALSRDRRFDGRFFTGVVTTGIYCRPVCPVSPPKFENMRFYACAAAAEAAGFRPCKRCRPETAPGTPAWAGTSAVVSRGLRLIADGGLDDGRVDAFAARLGLGERQVRRLFAEHLGASPADVARARRVHFARTLLDDSDLAITEVAHAAGFASIRQFNHSLKATFGETPTALRKRRSRRSVDARSGGILVKLPYRPPLAWSAMLDFLAHRAIPGVESVEAGVYRRTVEVGGEGGILEIENPSNDAIPGNAADRRASTRDAKGDAPHHAAHLRMRVELPHCRDLIGVVERARRIFDLGADSVLVGEHLSQSARLAPLVAATPGLRVPGAWDGFELAVRAVLGQQVTVHGATTLAGRLVREFGRPLAASVTNAAFFPAAALDAKSERGGSQERRGSEERRGSQEHRGSQEQGGSEERGDSEARSVRGAFSQNGDSEIRSGSLTHLFPRADVIAEADVARIGLPRARADALRALAAAVASGDLRFDASLGLDDAVARLAALPGLGPWTAHYIAMRALAEPDAFPETDLGLRHALSRGDGPASLREVREEAEAWRPWRAYAAIHLWSSLSHRPAVATPAKRKEGARAARSAEERISC